jgi:hypothetical protein
MEIDDGRSGDEADAQDPYDPGRPDALTWLQAWYTAHADGDWEHASGVRIGTLDNPGWSAEIDLSGTELLGRPFEKREIHRSEDDWLVVWVEDDKWNLACGPLNLAEGLHYFQAWAGDNPGH